MCVSLPHQNMEETVTKLRHDMAVVVSQRESLQAALTEASEGRRKAEERIKALAGALLAPPHAHHIGTRTLCCPYFLQLWPRLREGV